jgi:uncharacterized protein
VTALFLALALQLQIPAPVGFVNDFAGIIDPAVQQQMVAVIDEVRQKSRGEIVVVTLADLGGRAAADVARDIGRQWKVGAMGGAGDAARNAGVVLLLKPGQRPGDGRAEIFIATGSGSEGFLTDAAAGRIRDAIGQEAVAAGRYDAGLLRGVQLLAQSYAREFAFDLSGEATPPPEAQSQGRSSGLGILPILLLLFFFFMLASSRRRGRPRGVLSSLLWALFWSNVGRGRRGGGGWSGGSWGGGGGGGGGARSKAAEPPAAKLPEHFSRIVPGNAAAIRREAAARNHGGGAGYREGRRLQPGTLRVGTRGPVGAVHRAQGLRPGGGTIRRRGRAARAVREWVVRQGNGS